MPIIVVPYLVLVPKEELSTLKQHSWQENKLDLLVILLVKIKARRLRLIKTQLLIYMMKKTKNKKDKTNRKTKRERVRNINEYHKILGHPSEDTTRRA